jgi:hypothetical protein
MSDQARDALRRVSQALRAAAGLPAEPQTTPPSEQQPGANRRADDGTGALPSTLTAKGTAIYTPTGGDLPAAQGQNLRTKR